MEKQEKILTPDNKRYVLFPIRHDDIWQAYKQAEASFWTAEEVDLSVDVDHFNNKLNKNERHYIKNILAFFSASDSIVNENINLNLINDVQYPEARLYYGFQTMMEGIHSETYSLLIDTYIRDEKEKDYLLNAIETIDSVKKKAQWAFKWMGQGSFVEKMISFAIVEGVFFSSSFASIFYLKKRGLMPGLTFANELISRDEASHSDFACLLYRNHIEHKLTQARIYEIMEEAVTIEKEFVCDSLPVSLIGMNSKQMCEYLEYVADTLLVNLGCEKLYNSKNPFDFMEMLAVDKKTNFFEGRVAEYSISSMSGTSNKDDSGGFVIDEDF